MKYLNTLTKNASRSKRADEQQSLQALTKTLLSKLGAMGLHILNGIYVKGLSNDSHTDLWNLVTSVGAKQLMNNAGGNMGNWAASLDKAYKSNIAAYIPDIKDYDADEKFMQGYGWLSLNGKTQTYNSPEEMKHSPRQQWNASLKYLGSR